MIGQRLRTRMATGDYLLGTFSLAPSPEIIEIAAISGLDFVIVDLEHGAYDLGSARIAIATARARGMPVVVRVPEPKPSTIGLILDLGCDAVLVPHVTSAEIAVDVLRAARFAPEGSRGANPYVRAGDYGQDADFFTRANRDVAVMIMVEGPDVIRTLPDLAGMRGLDAIFLGPVDMSHALGLSGQPGHPRVISELARAAGTAARHGVAAAVFAPAPADAWAWWERGVPIVACGVDTDLIRTAFAGMAARARSGGRPNGEPQPPRKEPTLQNDDATPRRLRRLGAIETYLAETHAEQLGSTQLVALAEVDGLISVDGVRRALEDLRRRHPLLRVSLSRAEDGWWYVADGDEGDDVPLTVRTDGDADAWTDAVRAESDTPVTGPGPLWRATLLVDRARTRAGLVLAAHHATTDGVSLLALARQVVDAHNHAVAGLPLDAPVLPVRAPVEHLLPPTGGPAVPCATAEPFCPGWPVEQDAPLSARRTRTHWWTLEPPMTEALLARCRSEGTTLNAVIATALAAAARSLPNRLPELGCLIPISVRDNADPAVSWMENGTFISEVSLTLGAEDAPSGFWARARGVRARYRRLLSAVLAAPTDFERWPPNDSGMPTFRRGSLVTNLGRSAPTGKGGPARLASFRFLVCPRGGVYVISLSAATVANRMVIGLTSTDPLLGGSAADTFRAAFTAEIDRASGVAHGVEARR